MAAIIFTVSFDVSSWSTSNNEPIKGHIHEAILIHTLESYFFSFLTTNAIIVLLNIKSYNFLQLYNRTIS